MINIRLTFKDEERELVEYLKEKTNARAFIKDLIRREMMRDNNYINCNFNQVTENQNFVVEKTKVEKVEIKEEQNFDFDIDDLDI